MSSEINQKQIIEMAKDVTYIRERVEKIEKKLDSDYVTQDQLLLVRKEFQPTKTLSLWLLGIVALETLALLFYLIREVISR